MKNTIAVTVIFLSLISCSIFKQREQQQPELPPPAGYYPSFVRNIQPMNKGMDENNLRLEISRYSIADDENVELYFHLIDKGYTFVSGAGTSSGKGRWCGGKIIASQIAIPIERLAVRLR